MNDYLRSILTSEPLVQIQKNNLQNLFTTNYGRQHFSNIIFQNKFKEFKYHCLAKESFNDLFEMIFTAILQSSESNINNFENVRLLTKASFFYYK